MYFEELKKKQAVTFDITATESGEGVIVDFEELRGICNYTAAIIETEINGVKKKLRVPIWRVYPKTS